MMKPAGGGRDLSALGSAPHLVFDSTLPLYLALFGYASLLTKMFAGRAVIPYAVDLELWKSTSYVPALRAIIGSNRLFSVEELSGSDEELAESIRQLLPEKDYAKSSDNAGEAEAIVLARRLGSPLVIVERDGTLQATALKVATYSAVDVMWWAALTGACSDADAWDIYDRMINAKSRERRMGVTEDFGWGPKQATQARFEAELRRLRGA